MTERLLDTTGIRLRMEQKGLDASSLSALVGRSPSFVRGVMNGALPRRNREVVLIRLAQALGCSVGELYLSTESKAESA